MPKKQSLLSKWGFDSIAFMLRFMKQSRLPYIIGLLLISSYALLENIFSGQLYKVVSQIGQSSDEVTSGILFVFLLLVILFTSLGVGQIIFSRAVAAADKNLRTSLGARLSRMPMSAWYTRHSGDWLTVLGKDADGASEAYMNQLPNFTMIFIQAVGGLTILFASMPIMGFYSLISGGVYLWIGLFAQKRYKRYATGQKKAVAGAASEISDILGGFLVMKLYHTVKRLVSKNNEDIENSYRYGQGIARVSTLNSALHQIGYTLAYSGAFILGLVLVNFQQMTLPTMLSLWPISLGASLAITEFGFFVTEMQPTVAAVERIRGVFDLPQEQGGTLAAPAAIPTAVQLCDVSFAYRQDMPTLSHVSLEIRSGEKIAFVGESGSGKSTLVKLLMRFYDPQEGKILVYGQPAEQYRLPALRGLFAYVPQSAHLLSDSVYNNIAIVRPAAEEEIYQAAERAYAHEFIQQLSKGYQTEAGENGTQLSGGQRQRISIARAFLKQAPILIFDEVTASLDGESEAKIHKAMENTEKGQTLIMITHRLSSAVTADRIVVMDQGRVVEIGSHQELLKKQGAYARLWEMQFS